MDKRKAQRQYYAQALGAVKRDIDFNLTFKEWWDIWQQSGHYNERGCKKGQYVMARLGPDIGPYEVGNVVIQTCHQNNIDGNLNIPKSDEHKKKISEAGRKRKLTDADKDKIRKYRTGKHHTEETKAKMRATWALKPKPIKDS